MNEILYLKELCRDYLYGESVELKELDYENLYTLSNRHNLSAIVFAVINTSKNKEIVPETAYGKFQEDFYEAVIRYNVQNKVQDELSALLSENGIKHVFFKGAVLKSLYPVPEARVMGDIDLLISADNRDTVKKLLTSNGYTCEASNGAVYNYSKDGALIEMHTKIISDRVGASNAEKCFENAFEKAEFNGCVGEFDVNYHFAYLIAHIAHHFCFYGAGIKLVLDLAVILQKCSIDIEKVFALLEEAGLAEFAKVILTVCNRWFGAGEDYGIDITKTEEFLLSYGAFGNINRNNAAVIERKELEEGKKVTPFVTKLRLLFPSYEKLRKIDYISFIDGKPYLTPAAWVYRAGYNFKYKKSFVKNSVKAIGSDETNSEAEKEFAYFKEIGLL